MTVPQLRAILWCAVSSETQARDEKASLEEQERLLRELADREDWLVTDVLIVPGFSRRFYNYPEFMNAAAANGIDAPEKLYEHWQARDFDVLACRYGSRFAREQSIFSEVVQRTIDIGARIFTLQDGWVDQSSYRMFISMGGYAASKEIDELQQRYQMGMNKRAERGLPVSSAPPLSHRLVRNPESGKAEKLVLDESKRRLFDDIATLLLGGTPWNEIPVVLFEQHGHANTKGKPYSSEYLWRMLYTPWIWGHAARHYSRKTEPNGRKQGIWAFDETAPLPDGVKIWRNTHEPVYTGEQADLIKAELTRRKTLKGRAGHGTSAPFTGLLYCGSCGYRLSFQNDAVQSSRAYKCISKRSMFRLESRSNCTTKPRRIKLSIVQEWFTARLAELINTGDMSTWLPTASESPPPPRIDLLETEIADLERRIEGLLLQAVDNDGVSSVRNDMLARYGEQLTNLQSALQAAQTQKLETDQRQQAVTDTVAAIREMDIEKFWEQEKPVINRMLLTLLGDHRIIVQNGEIQGIARVSA